MKHTSNKRHYISLLIVSFLSISTVFSEPSHADPETEFKHARELSHSGKYDEAISVYKSLLSDNPDNADYLLGIGQTHNWNNESEQALPYLEKAKILAPDYQDVYQALANTYQQLGRKEDAKKLFAEAKERFPENSEWIEAKQAMASVKPSLTLRLDHRLDNLSNDNRDWHATTFTLIKQFDEGKQLAVYARDSERFDIGDTLLGLEGYYRIDRHWHTYLRLDYSGTYRVLPHYLAHGRLGYVFDNGWGVIGGYKHVKYRESNTSILDTTIEKYFSNYRLAYTTYFSDSNTAGNTISHLFQMGYTIPQDWNINVGFGIGAEAEKNFAANTVIDTDFTSVALWGEYYLDQNWSLNYALAYTLLDTSIRGDSNRKEYNLGINYHF